MSELSETERARRQTIDEWRAELIAGDNNKSSGPQRVVKPKIKLLQPETSRVPKDIRKAGIVSVRYAGDRLLITLDRPLTVELDNRIKQGIHTLVKYAEPDTGESVYEYVGYRTLFSDRKPYLAIVLKDVHTGTFAERFFNIDLRDRNGNSFKTGDNGEFRIKGSIKRPIKGSFIQFWMNTAKQLPDSRASHIYRYMNSWLRGIAVSCSDEKPHHDGIKLVTLKYEGHLYEII